MPIDRRLFLQLAAGAALGPAAEAGGLDVLGPLYQSSIIRDENLKQGSREWRFLNPASNREIEGSASATSINRGESIQFFISTSDPSWTAEVFRLGWYGGDGGRKVLTGIERAGKRQEEPVTDPTTGLIECRWTDPWTLSVPSNDDWPSGTYIAKFTARPSGLEWHIPFTVRDDSRRSVFLFQNSVTTWQAYNSWGGKSLYTGSPQARIVSFDRPYKYGTGDLFVWEYYMIRFLEREGYDVAYCTNVDLHRDPGLPARANAFLSVGHDEYWSWEMRAHAEASIAAGRGFGFFGGNNVYWQIRFAPNADGVANRRVIAYKERARTEDPVAIDGDPSNDHLTTTLWRNAPVNRPEEALIGVMWEEWNWGIDGDIVITDALHWIYDGTGARNGDRLVGLLGYEVDRIFGFGPPNVERIAHSPFIAQNGETHYSDMTFYEAPSGAGVFAAGSIQWSWGLDYFGGSRESRVSSVAQQMTRNILSRLAVVPGRRRRRVSRL